MQSLSPTYACPHCAEAIQLKANTCRFCKQDVRLTVTFKKKPTGTSLSELVQILFERFGKSQFPTYGAMRKALEEPQAVIASGIHRADANEISHFVSEFDGEAIAFLTTPDQAQKSADPKTSSIRLSTVLELVALAFGISFYFWYDKKPSEPPSTTTEIKSENVSYSPMPDLKVQKQSEGLISKKKFPQIHFNIKTLIEATATLRGNSRTGSAFFIHKDGYLITNHHVTKKMPSFLVQTADGKTRPGRLIRYNEFYDLALVKVEGGPYEILKLGDATSLEPGETVWTIGAPHGLSFTVTKGIVSYVGRKVQGKSFIQADVAINPGNSGGPMINSQGEVVGINNFVVSNAEGLNFAIPINFIYMGNSPIARQVVSTFPDNSIMAQWRGQESHSSNSFVSSVTPKEDLSSAQLNAIFSELSTLKNNYTSKKNRSESIIQNLRFRLTKEKSKYENLSATISQEVERGKKVAKLTQEILEEQIQLSNNTLDYCSRVERLLKKARGLQANDMKHQKYINSQIQQIRELKNSFSDLKKSKLAELKTAQEQVY